MKEQSLGKQPDLKWIDIDDLSVDQNYQRSADSKKSKATINKIANNFHWDKFCPLIVAQRADRKKYLIVDGQHRALAVLQRGDIEKVPCCVISSSNIVDEASSFIGINKDRVRLTPMAEFYAQVAANDPSALEIKELLDDVGLKVSSTPPLHGMNKPSEVACVGALKWAIRKHKKSTLKQALKSIYEAYPNTEGQMRSMFIKALCELITASSGLNREHLIETIKNIDPESAQDAARSYVKIEGGSVLEAATKYIARAYNAGLPKTERIEA